jgi:hypothetical protein
MINIDLCFVAAYTFDICYRLSTKKVVPFLDDELIGYEEIPELSPSLHT